MTYKTPMKAIDPCELERRIMDGSIAKNEAEWWAQHEIERLRGELEEAKVTRGNGVLVPSDELKRMKAQLAAKDAVIEKLRSALEIYAQWHHGDEAKEVLAATQDDCAILRSHASDIDVANRIEEIALALDGYFSYERDLDPYIDELNKLAAKIRNGEGQP